MIRFMIQKQSGIQLGVYTESGSEDHEFHAQALRRAKALDGRLAEYQRTRDAVLADPNRSAEGKAAAIAQLSAAELGRLASDLDYVKAARLAVSTMKGAMLFGAPAPDAVATMRAIELRTRFAALDEASRMDELGNAIERHSPRDLVFLRAILEDGELMTPVPPLYRDRLTNVVMELSNPDAFKRMTRLHEQVEEFAGAVAAAQRYLGEDVNLSDRERARQADDEQFRRSVVFVGGAIPDGGDPES